MKNTTLYILASFLILITACDPILEDKIDIGSAPQASFTVEFIDLNNVRFTNTTADEHFITNWDFGTLGIQSGTTVELNMPFQGDYPVSLTVFGKGGSTTKTEIVTITQDDPNNCNSLTAFLTGCGQKVWKLNPEAGALWVGPNDGTGIAWWQNTASDVTGRPCDWNDEYIFNIDGSYVYDSKGDLWGESYMGFSTDQCYDITQLSADRAAWGSGTHTFEVIPATAGTPTQLKVIGNGAFLGLRKAANGMEVTHPQTEVTYDVLNTSTVGNKDILELEVNYNAGLWRFTLASE